MEPGTCQVQQNDSTAADRVLCVCCVRWGSWLVARPAARQPAFHLQRIALANASCQSACALPLLPAPYTAPHCTAVHREPAESWHTFKGGAFHPLTEAPEQQLQLAAPPGAAAQSMITAAGVLVSQDSGASWKPLGDVEVRGS